MARRNKTKAPELPKEKPTDDELIAELFVTDSAVEVRRILAIFGAEVPSVVDAMVVRSLLKSATGGDTSAARFWLTNRADQWSQKGRRKTKQPAEADQKQDDSTVFKGLKLVV
jgi:hypothetical protein